MDWTVFHKYGFLASQGIVKPLSCPICENNVALTIGDDEDPALQCYYCGTLTTIGLTRYDEIRAVVKEFYE